MQSWSAETKKSAKELDISKKLFSEETFPQANTW